MLLVVDVGNTNIAMGLMDGDRVAHTFRVSTRHRTTDELSAMLLQLLTLRGLDRDCVGGVICSSVVPTMVYTIEKAIRRTFDVGCLMVGRGLRTGMQIRTDNPREVGADRIVNAVAAADAYGGPVIVCDFGTATTFDCVDASCSYVGGVIAPGLRISEDALYSRTAQLPRVRLERPPNVIGGNTVHAMQSGLLYGYVGLVDALIVRIQAEMGQAATVVATGGYASLISEEAAHIQHVDPYLTLRGLAKLYAINAGEDA